MVTVYPLWELSAASEAQTLVPGMCEAPGVSASPSFTGDLGHLDSHYVEELREEMVSRAETRVVPGGSIWLKHFNHTCSLGSGLQIAIKDPLCCSGSWRVWSWWEAAEWVSDVCL